MIRALIFASLIGLLAIGASQTYLWMRDIRPSPRRTWWEEKTWEFAPKDEQQKRYLRARFIAGLVTMPIAVAIVNLLFYAYDRIMQ